MPAASPPSATAPPFGIPSDLATPALLVDLAVLEGRLAEMASEIDQRGVHLRPHAKTHKTLEIARRQLDAGAVGLTVATLGEAEVMAKSGASDLFIAYPVFGGGPGVLERLEGLAREVRLSVGVESPQGARSLAGLAASGASVLVEVDSGQHRTGVPPEGAGDLALECRRLGLAVAGVFTHGGHAYRGPEWVARAADDEVGALQRAAGELTRAGVDVEVVSAGSSPTARRSARPPVTEVRPGTYVFGDRQQQRLCAGTDGAAGAPAAAVATTVVSARPGRFVIDAGSKALTAERPAWLQGFGEVVGPHAGTVVSVSEHHGVVEGAGPVPAVGDVVAVVPNHICPVVNLFDELVAVREGSVVARWAVAARGR